MYAHIRTCDSIFWILKSLITNNIIIIIFKFQWLCFHRRYLEETKDREINITPWTGDPNGSIGACREIRFIRPVNMLGCPHTRAVKVSLMIIHIRVYMIFFCLEKRCEHLHIFLPGKTVYMMHKCKKCVEKV